MLRFNLYSSAGALGELLATYDKVGEHLDESYISILEAARNTQSKLLGIELAEMESDRMDPQPVCGPVRIVKAELFRNASTLCGLVIGVSETAYRMAVIQETGQRGTLRVFTLADSQDERTAADFVESMQDLFKVSLNSRDVMSDRARSLIGEGLAQIVVAEQAEHAAARTLAGKDARELAVAIKLGSGLLVDLAKQMGSDGQAGLPSVRERLLESDLVVGETVVLCGKTGQAISRVRSRSTLDAMADAGLRCSCGKPANEEKIEEALSITELGRDLLDKSRWMTLVLIEELLHIGVSPDHIFVEQQFDGDEIACIAIISGDVVLFELRDGRFSLGHAHSFNAKIGIVQPDYSMVVTTEKIGNDAKIHFDRRRQAVRKNMPRPYVDESVEPLFVEGISNLRAGLEDLVTNLVTKDARRVLSEVLPLAGITPGTLLRGWTTRSHG